MKKVLYDPLCEDVICRVDVDGMNKEYKTWYKLIRDKSTFGVVYFMWKTRFKKRTLSPILNKVLGNSNVRKIYCKIRGYQDV